MLGRWGKLKGRIIIGIDKMKKEKGFTCALFSEIEKLLG
jgi:hypothetical protein